MSKTFSWTQAGFAVAGLLAGALVLAGFDRAPDDRDSRTTSTHVAPRCLDGQHIAGKHVVDDHTLLVYNDWGDAYKLDIGGPCRSMDDWSRIGFEFEGGSQICDAHDAQILYSKFDEAPVRCLINGVHPLTKAEAAALDPGNRG